MFESEIKVFNVPLHDIFYDEEFNCRGKIPPSEVVDLAKDIDIHGLANPILLQPWTPGPQKYRIVCGHRRFMAFKLLKRDDIPAIIRHNLNEIQALTINLSENLKRKDLNMLQEARTLKKYFDMGVGEFRIAELVGMSRGWVQIRRELLSLPEDIQEAAASGFLTAEHIRDLYNLPTDEQYAAVREIKDRRNRGDKRAISVKKNINKPTANVKRVRKRPDMFTLMEYIQSQIGNNLATRALAWSAGEITDLEMHTALREFAAEQGKIYEYPVGLL